MAFFPPIPLIRKKYIIKQLRRCGAVSERTAKSFAEAGIINPDSFKRVEQLMLDRGQLGRTSDGRFYLK